MEHLEKNSFCEFFFSVIFYFWTEASGDVSFRAIILINMLILFTLTSMWRWTEMATKTHRGRQRRRKKLRNGCRDEQGGMDGEIYVLHRSRRQSFDWRTLWRWDTNRYSVVSQKTKLQDAWRANRAGSADFALFISSLDVRLGDDPHDFGGTRPRVINKDSDKTGWVFVVPRHSAQTNSC